MPWDKSILIAREPTSWGRRTIPDTYQEREGLSTKVRIIRPDNSDPLRRADFSDAANRIDSGQIPIAPVTRFRKNRARKPSGNDDRQSLNLS